MHTAQRASVLLALQRTHGNRYVQRVVAGIQAKLTIGQPGDKYEQEADRVAEQVMRMPEPHVQRQAEEEELIQPKPLAGRITPLVQRQADKEEQEEEEEILQTKENPGQTSEITPTLESRINSLKGGGQPLPKSARVFFEPRFGRDFSQVRVHSNSKAAKMARALNTKAFTTGLDIVFGVGQYAPERLSGKKLLAHELTHVVQQVGIRKTSSIQNIIEGMQVQLSPTMAEGTRAFTLEIPWSAAGYRDFKDRIDKKVQKLLKVPSGWLPQLMHKSNLGDVYDVLNEEKPLRPEGVIVKIKTSFWAEESLGESRLHFQVAARPATGKMVEAVAEEAKKTAAKKPQKVYMVTSKGKDYYITEEQFKSKQHEMYVTLRRSWSSLDNFVDIERKSHRRFAKEVHNWCGVIADLFAGTDLPSWRIWVDARDALIKAHLACIWFSVAEEPAEAAKFLAKYAKHMEVAERQYNLAHKEWCQYRYATIKGAETAVKVLEVTRDISFTTAAALGTVTLMPTGMGLLGKALFSTTIDTGFKLLEETATRLSQTAYGEEFNWGEMINNLGATALTSLVGSLTAGALKKHFTKLIFNEKIAKKMFKELHPNVVYKIFVSRGQDLAEDFISEGVGKGLVKGSIQNVLDAWLEGEYITMQEFVERIEYNFIEGTYKLKLQDYLGAVMK
jgi:hypothetical protein